MFGMQRQLGALESFDNFDLANKVCSIALIFIMFYGGFGTRWSEAKPVAGRAITLASLGVFHGRHHGDLCPFCA